MSDSNYNKIISTINSVSRDYTYSPDPNNLICIDTSNNRIGINTLDPEVSLHISGGSIRIGGDISASGDIRVNNIYANVISASRYATSFGQSSVISATNISATNNIDASSIVVTNILDISRGRIIANNIDISSTLDISMGRIRANFIDVSSVLDISRGRIFANFIDVSSVLDISRGLIRANNIDISSVLDISRGVIRANNIDISSTLDISRGRIFANNIDVSSISVSSILDISKGLILANTISGSAITINVNANASSDIITINIGNSNGVKINTATNSNANDITINGVRLATTQHIRNVIPYGVIMAYYTTPAPPGWAICDGSNGTPDLRGRFILSAGQGVGVDSNGDAFIDRIVGVSGGAAFHTLTTQQIPSHNHTYNDWNLGFGAFFSQGSNKIGCGSGSEQGEGTTWTGGGLPHNNMPPFYVLVYIMKTTDYDFCYNVVPLVSSAPTFTAVQFGLTSVKVDWLPPSNIGGSPIIQYYIYRNGVRVFSLSAVDRTYTITGLTFGQTYSFYVTASNSQGESLSLTPISITIASVPSAPTISRGITQGIGYPDFQDNWEYYNVTINWTTPLNGGSPITAYNMYENGSTSPIVISGQSTSTTRIFQLFTTTSITLKAQNVAGLSLVSNTLNITVP